MPALMLSSSTSTTSSSRTRMSSSTSGIGKRPATPSAMVSAVSVFTTAPARHDSARAGAPAGVRARVGFRARAGPPRQRQRRRAGRLDADPLDVWGDRLRDAADAAGHGAAAERDEQHVDALRRLFEQLQPDGPRAVAREQLQAVFDEVGAV